MIYVLFVFLILFVVVYVLCFWWIDRNAEREFSALAMCEINARMADDKRKKEKSDNE